MSTQHPHCRCEAARVLVAVESGPARRPGDPVPRAALTAAAGSGGEPSAHSVRPLGLRLCVRGQRRGSLGPRVLPLGSPSEAEAEAEAEGVGGPAMGRRSRRPDGEVARAPFEIHINRPTLPLTPSVAGC